MRAILLYIHVMNAFASIPMLPICLNNNNGKVIFTGVGMGVGVKYSIIYKYCSLI